MVYTCGVWGAKAGVQVSRREFHTHIHLNYVIVEFLFHIKNFSGLIGNIQSLKL